MPGLIDLLNVDDEQNGSSNIIQPLLPGHVMVFDINKDGKMDLDETKQFHSFEIQPLHLKHQGVEMKEGKEQNNVFIVKYNKTKHCCVVH